MRKALTLRAVPAALGIAILAAGPAAAQSSGPASPPTEVPPPPGDTATTPPPPPSDTGNDSAAQPTASITDIAVGNAALSTLTKAVQAADLAGPLDSGGPFTVFAPTNDAFAKLPAGTLDTLTKPENKAKLTSLLNYHVVSGAVTAADLAGQIQAGGGKAKLTTLAGGTLTASLDGSDVILTDAKGGKSRVVVADVKASNGIVHAVDTVVMP